MARRARVTTWYARRIGAVIRPGSERARAMARTIRALLASESLPGIGDFEAYRKPVGRAWVRRVAGRNLWLWYRFSDDELLLLMVTTDPPVPLEE